MNFSSIISGVSKPLLIVAFSFFVATSFAQNTDYDKKVGKENAQTVIEQMGIYESKAMNDYITSIGNRLVNQLENPLFEYHFYLVNNPEPNAFALPGGYIFITTGLIPILRTEDELACIMGHEIIHSNNRHSVKQMRKGIVPGILAIPGAILGIVNDNLGAVFMSPSHLMVAGYSRKYETEADVEGVALAIKAGYNPNALKDALTRMTSTIELATGSEEEKSYFSDHPYTPDRVSKINKEISEVELQLLPPLKKEFAPVFNGIIFGTHPKYGVTKEQTILNPTLNLYINFPKDWELGVDAGRMMGIKKSQDAAIVFAEETQFDNADSAAAAFLKNVPEAQKKNVMQTTFEKHGQLQEGVLIAMREKTNTGIVYAHILWLPYQGKMLKIVAMSTKEQLATLKEIVLGMRTLNAQEKNSIKIKYMSTLQANGSESLTQLSDRSNNILKMTLLESINDAKADDVLKKSEVIKVINDKVYLVK